MGQSAPDGSQPQGFVTMLLRFLKCAKGATSIEYALIASLISVAVIGGATAVGNSSTVQMQNIAGHL
jgi:pilus assembly protein Flp/PilA